MRTITAIQSGAAVIALLGCVHTASLVDSDTLSARVRPVSLNQGAATTGSAGLDRTGFLQRQSSVRGAYFITPSEIAEMAPRTIADIFRHVPVLLENPFPARSFARAQDCFITYVNGIARRSLVFRDLDTFIPARDVVAAEVYPPGQLPPAPFARASSGADCTTVAIWTRSALNDDKFNARHSAVTK